MNSNQLNNSNNKQLFSNQPSSSISSMIFMSTSSQNDHPITISSTQQKRKQFENKIRQQSRNRFKQNLRKKQQLQLLKSMGIQTHQHEHQHGQQYDNHSYYDNQQQHQGQQQRQQQLFEQIQQQADNIVVEYFTNFSYTNSNSYNHNSNNNINSNGDNNHQQQQQQDQTIDSSNNMYLRRSYQEIQQYKQKEFCQDSMKLWKHIQKGIQQYMKSSTISLSKRTTKTNHILNNNNTIQWLIETLRAINHILVMEMFYSQIEWVQFRCVHPQQYNGIFEWLWVVYCEYIRQYQQQQQQSSQRDNNNNNVFFQQMKQSISTLILILICYQLKIQGCTVKQRPFQQYTTSTYTLSNHRDNNNNNNNNNNRDNNSNSNNSNSNSNTKRRKLWQNRILFEQLLQVQWLWSHWSVIKMSNVIDLNVYCIGKMLGIVDKQSKKIEVEIDSFNNNKDNNNNNNYINFHKKQTSNLINHLLNISTLVQNIKQLITTIVIKINNYNKLNIYNIGYNNNNSNSNNQGCYGEFVYQNRLKNIVMKVYEVIGGVNGVLSGMSGMVNMVDNSNGSINMNQRSSVNNNQQSTIPSLVFIKSLQLLFITDRLFAIINSHQQQNHYLQRQHQQYQQQQQQHQQQQQSLIRRQLQKHYQTLVKHTLLQKDHYVYLYLGQDDKMMRNNRKDIKRDMECFYKEFVGVKLITMTEILTLSLQSVCRQQYNSNNNQQNKYQHHQQNTTIPSYNPFQLKCLSLSLTTIIHMFEQQHTLINNLLQSTYYQQINSIQHLCELFKKIKNGQCNNDSSSVGVYLVLMCKQLLGVIGEMVIRIVNVDVDANVNVDVDANVNVNGKKHQHSQSSQFVIKNNQQSLLVSILLMAIKAINTIAEVQQLNIFKYSCLLYQAVAMSRTKQNRWQQNQRKHQKQQQQKQQQIFPSRSSKSLIELSHLFLQYLNNNFNNKKNKNNKNNSNKNYKNSNKNMRLVDIKQQLGLFVQNIVYNQFPLQTHFEEFSIKKSNNESNVKEVGRLVESYQELTRNSKNNKTAQQSRITTKQHHHLHSIFTQPYLDNQTNQLLQTVQSLLQQSCIQTQLQAIKIVNLLILMCDNKSAFNYFVQKIKSQTEIYKIVEFMAQQAGHDKVRQVAEQFVDGVEGGYREDEDQDDQYQNEDSNNQGRDNNKYAINNKSEDNKEIEI